MGIAGVSAKLEDESLISCFGYNVNVIMVSSSKEISPLSVESGF